MQHFQKLANLHDSAKIHDKYRVPKANNLTVRSVMADNLPIPKAAIFIASLLLKNYFVVKPHKAIVFFDI